LLTFRFSGRKATLTDIIEPTFWKISIIYAED